MGRSASANLGITVVVVAAVAVGLTARSWYEGDPSRDDADAAGALPSVSAADPFAGSPAAAYATGEAGVVPPAANAVGGFSAAQVKAAFTVTGALVVAAGLDRATLLGGQPAAFAAVLSLRERRFFLDHLGGRPASTRSEVVSFAPHSADLVGDAVKVHGSMTAAPAVHGGRRYLDVKVDYLFVYAIRSPGKPATLERFVARLTGTNAYSSDASTWLNNWGISASPASCDAGDGYLHPTYASSAGSSKATGAPINPYDQSSPQPPDVGCRMAEGT